ncbi:MAG: hypothetical protein QXJ74_07880 [Nitrososphaera sp.]
MTGSEFKPNYDMTKTNPSFKEYFIMFLNRDGTIGDFLHDAPIAYWHYEDFRNHGNEWYDLLFEGYEMWISNLQGRRPRVEPIIEEIKRDFAGDGIQIELSHKYHGKWLVVRAKEIDDEPPKEGNCDYHIDDERQCERPNSPLREDIVDYLYLCDEHYENKRAEQKEWHANDKEYLHNTLLGQDITICDYCEVDMKKHQLNLHDQDNDKFHKLLLEWGYSFCEYCNQSLK